MNELILQVLERAEEIGIYKMNEREREELNLSNKADRREVKKEGDKR